MLFGKKKTFVHTLSLNFFFYIHSPLNIGEKKNIFEHKFTFEKFFILFGASIHTLPLKKLNKWKIRKQIKNRFSCMYF